MPGKELKTGLKKVPEDEFRIASPDIFQEYHVAAVTAKQSPFGPVVWSHTIL